MTARDSNIANFFETTLSAQMGATDTTATVTTTTGAPSSPCYVVIEPQSATQREVIYMDGTFTSTTFVTSGTGNRYLDGSAAGSGLTHPSGSVVWVAVLAQHIEDIHDRIDAISDHGSLDGLADDDHTQYLNNARHDALDHTGLPGIDAGTTVTTAKATKTDGNVTLTSTLTSVTGCDVTIAAVAGDEIGVEAIGTYAGAANFASLGAATIVSSSVVNYIVSGSSTASYVPGWAAINSASTQHGFSGEWRYTVQAGDIDDGDVLIRLRGVTSDSTHTLRANTTDPLRLQVTNYGQAS